MKKYLMMACAALAFVSCSKTEDVSDSSRSKVEDTYKAAFLKYVGGSIASNQTWGFSSNAYTRGLAFTRSQAAPAVAEITAPYDEAWVTAYCETAQEPSEANKDQNAKNFQYPTWEWSDEYKTKRYTTGFKEAEQAFYDENIKPFDNSNLAYYGTSDWTEAKYEVYKRLVAGGYSSWANVTAEPTYVLNFKITGTWNGAIGVVESEGLTNGVENGSARTVVVKGTWNLTAGQKVGLLGRIIIANGGVLNISEDVLLQFVNQARLVVLPGGQINGGKIEISNGNATGYENYNGGTINVDLFNNNFGKFFNYGTFIADEYAAGATESNFYNHSLVKIGRTGDGSEAPNARIFNNCQWYCTGDMRARNYEGMGGSALIVDGQLMFSGSEDGTGTGSYVGLAGGALVQCGSLWNNGTSWSGPNNAKDGAYAVLSVGKIVFINYGNTAAENGYFENNIYVQSDNWEYVQKDGGKGANKTAKVAFADVQNATGNGNVTIVEKGTYEVIPASEDFVLGVSGCTPGFKIKKDEPTADLRIIAEDLSASQASDFDFNDIVLDVKYGSPAVLTLQAAGGTLPLRINEDNNLEVHKLFGVGVKEMVNTQAGPSKSPVTIDATKGFNVTITTPEEAANLKIEVQKEDGTWYPLTAVKGEPASKLAVASSFKWLSERKSIKAEYPLFIDWATSANFTSKWW